MLNRRSLLRSAIGSVGALSILGSTKAEPKLLDGCVGAWAPSEIITLDPSLVYPEVIRSFNVVPKRKEDGVSLNLLEKIGAYNFSSDSVSTVKHHKFYPFRIKKVKTGEDWGEVYLAVEAVSESVVYESRLKKRLPSGYAEKLLIKQLTKRIKDDIFHTLLAAGADRNVVCLNHLSMNRVNYCSPDSFESYRKSRYIFDAPIGFQTYHPTNIVEDFDFGGKYDKYLVDDLHYEPINPKNGFSPHHFGVSVNLDPESTIFIQPDWGKPKVSTNVLMEYDENFNFKTTPFKKDGYETLQVIMVYGVAILDTEEVTLLSLRTT